MKQTVYKLKRPGVIYIYNKLIQLQISIPYIAYGYLVYLYK